MQPIVLRGFAANWIYTLPSGEEAQSAVLELQTHIFVQDLAAPTSHVELTLPERFHVTWQRYVGRNVEVQCEGPVYAASLWGYPHASCAVADVRAAP